MVVPFIPYKARTQALVPLSLPKKQTHAVNLNKGPASKG